MNKLSSLAVALITFSATQSQITIQPDSASYESLIGNPLPEFIGTSLDGTIYTPESLRGKVVLINFWYIGCFPCMREIPHFNQIHRDYKDSAFMMISIAPQIAEDLREFNSDDTTSLNSFARIRTLLVGDHFIEYPVIPTCLQRKRPMRGDTVFAGVECDSIVSDFLVTGYPTTAIVDKHGIIRMMDSGFEIVTLGPAVVSDGKTRLGQLAENDVTKPPSTILKFRAKIEELLAED